MRKALRREAWVFCMVCLGGLGVTSAWGADATDWLISGDLLDHAKLTMVWQKKLAVRKGEKIEQMVLLNDRLYVRSARNYTWSLDRNTGRGIFNRSIAPAGFPILGWTSYENRLISVIDNQLVQFDRDTGVTQSTDSPDVSIVAPPVRNSRFFYLSGGNQRLHALRADDLVELFQVSAKNESTINSVLADEERAIFATDAGNLIAIAADAPRKLWQFDAVEGISGPVIRDGRSLYFASRDTNVYRVDMVDTTAVTLVWKFQAEALLDRAPRVTPHAVYQYALGRGLSAIDKTSGRTLWSLPEGLDLLADTAGRAYVMTKFKTLAVMDNVTGRKLYAVNFAPVVYHAANPLDRKIYVAGADGRLACLEPIQ
ncbi:MAG: PQQ-binding-like beta-propeller repeat protein [Sedimentisphaerales bacterium]|nr:PQQ-binding-like beta-propeller repeat protein [Sedimentisphaerales bacterium]